MPTGWNCSVCRIPCGTERRPSEGLGAEHAQLAVRARPRTVRTVTQKRPDLNQAARLSAWKRRWIRTASIAHKELALNYFPISFSLWQGTVVPLGEVVVEDDFQVVFEAFGVLTASGVNLVKQADGYAQAEERRVGKEC